MYDVLDVTVVLVTSVSHFLLCNLLLSFPDSPRSPGLIGAELLRDGWLPPPGVNSQPGSFSPHTWIDSGVPAGVVAGAGPTHPTESLVGSRVDPAQ